MKEIKKHPMADNKLWQQIRAIEEKDLPYAKATDELYSLFKQRIDDLRQKIVILRNEAHVNCFEDEKEAFNTVINLFDKHI